MALSTTSLSTQTPSAREIGKRYIDISATLHPHGAKLRPDIVCAEVAYTKNIPVSIQATYNRDLNEHIMVGLNTMTGQTLFWRLPVETPLPDAFKEATRVLLTM
jgi:hypothetical protein